MFFLFNISNPFKKLVSRFYKHHWCWDKKLATHKFFEIETFIDSDYLLELQVDLRLTGRDHAGSSITLSVFCLAISARIYDHRHWDYKNNRWEEYI